MGDRIKDIVKKKIQEEEQIKEKGQSKMPPPLFKDNETFFDQAMDGAKSTLEGKYSSKGKKVLSYAKMANNALGAMEYGTVGTGIGQALQDKFKISNVKNAYKTMNNQPIKNPGAFKLPPKLGKLAKGAGKGLQILGTAEDTYELGKAIHDGHTSNTIKSSVDLLSEATLYSKNPVVMSFGAGYEGMKMVNEMTDNAVPDTVYDGLFNGIGGMDDIQKETLKVKGDTNRMDLELKVTRDALAKKCHQILLEVIASERTLIELRKDGVDIPPVIQGMPSVAPLNDKKSDIADQIINLQDLEHNLSRYLLIQKRYIPKT